MIKIDKIEQILQDLCVFGGSVPFSVSAAISTKPVSFGYRCKVS